jgi:hypothetical protein
VAPSVKVFVSVLPGAMTALASGRSLTVTASVSALGLATRIS